MVCNACQIVIMVGSSFCYNCGAKHSGASQAGPLPTPTAAQHSRGNLMRSSTYKNMVGVCAGVSNYLDLDVTLVRVLWVLAFFCGGTGLLLYIILWIVLPVEPMYVPVAAQSAPTP